MLVFLILFSFLRTLQGASVPPHASASVATANVLAAMASECPVAPDDGGQQFRTVNSIVQSCLFTVFACVWTSAHPNINGPRDSRWTCFKRKVLTMLYMLIAPEMVLLWALCQRTSAKEIAKMYNATLSGSGEAETESLWGKIAGCFQPLPKDTTRRGDGQLERWTTTHGFFIQMGGFILYENEYPKQVLSYNRLAKLLQNKAIDTPTVTERDLQDRSKSDAVSKAILLLQTTWFVLQCVTRWGQRLPLSELEVLTLAFAVLNVAIYVVWWDKPQGVEMAICVPLKRAKDDIYATNTPPTGEGLHKAQSLSQTELQSNSEHSVISDKQPLIPLHEPEPDVSTGEKRSWLQRMLGKDREQRSTPSFLLFRLPYRIVASVLRLFNKVGLTDEIMKNELRVPMFYASDSADEGTVLASYVIGTIFGAIHLLAWASEFPSFRDLVLWRVSAIVMTVVPFLMLLSKTSEMLEMEMIGDCIVVSFIPVAPFYIPSRCIVIVIALLAIRNPPQDVLRDVSWTSYIPHF